jgi:carbonic anhydrase
MASVPNWRAPERCKLTKSLIALTGGIILVLAVVSPAQWKTYWSYEGASGPEHWGDLDPAYALCKSGTEQSPIDIQNTEKTTLPVLRFEYKNGPLEYLINNGYTIRVNYHDAPGSGNFLVVGAKRYHLTQFHFHRPSEEYVRGKQYDMVAHLMHESSDGGVVGVAVLMKSGGANATVQQIWAHMPVTKGDEQDVRGVEVNPAGLLPRDTGYYEYAGSLTAPPCTESVMWFVLKTPVDIPASQIQAFAKLYPHDVRPIQPLNGRVVKESQ